MEWRQQDMGTAGTQALQRALARAERQIASAVGQIAPFGERGLESIVCKRADSVYRSGRSKAWVNVKNFERSDFIVVGRVWEQGRPEELLAEESNEGVRFVGRAFNILGSPAREQLTTAIVPALAQRFLERVEAADAVLAQDHRLVVEHRRLDRQFLQAVGDAAELCRSVSERA